MNSIFIVEHPLIALIITLGVLIFFKLLFAISNFLENLGNSKKSNAPKESKTDTKKEEKATSKITEENPKEEKIKPICSVKTSSADNYLYDRFVVSPTKDDSRRNEDKICNAFLEDNEAKNIRDKKLDIRVEPLDIEKEKSKKVKEILLKYEDKEKLLDDFSNMPREMKLLILENIMKNM